MKILRLFDVDASTMDFNLYPKEYDFIYITLSLSNNRISGVIKESLTSHKGA